MKAGRRSSERGQALVVIVLAVVGLFGFAALAIDGGMLYSQRRQAQNAADTAAFAAAMAALDDKSEAEIEQAGLYQAQINGFDNGDSNDVEVHHPPESGPYTGNMDFYQVKIRTDFEPIFSHFIFGGALENTVEAVAKAQTASNISPSNAMHSTAEGDTYCKGIWFTGNASTTITGANIFANSEADANNCQSGVRDGSGKVTVNNGSIYVAGGFDGWEQSPGVMDTSQIQTEDSVVHEGVDPMPLPPIDPPDCSIYDNNPKAAPNGSAVLEPGYYTGDWKINGSDSVQLKPGMYCIDGELKSTGGSIETIPFDMDGDGSEEYGVLLYMMTGSFSLSGQTQVKLDRANDLTDNGGNHWGGMLLYMPYQNKGEVVITGGSGSTYTGVIYAPGPPHQNNNQKCSVGGNSGTLGLNSQLICYSIKMHGGANIEIIYIEEELYKRRPAVELMQ